MVTWQYIGIVSKPFDKNNAYVSAVVKWIYEYLTNRGYNIFVDDNTGNCIMQLATKNMHFLPVEEMSANCDLIFSLGGDGTFISVARESKGNNVPIVGINLGTLGFLTDVIVDQIEEQLDIIFNGIYTLEHRPLLQVQIERDGEVIHSQVAANEVVVHRWITPSVIQIETRVDGKFVSTQRSDGMIVATPTGSTAYSLSAGGSIIHPSVPALLLVPLNPHTLTNRPIIVSENSTIELTFNQKNEINALVTCDHLEIPNVLVGDKIIIKKAANGFMILHPKTYDYYATLREKLNWSQ